MAARKSIFTIVRWWSIGWLTLVGMPVSIIGKRPARGRYIYVANHKSYIDSVIIFAGLPGYFRALGKKEISKIPVIGFIYKQLVIMVDRSSSHSRARSMRLMWRALSKESNIIIFPEGTFNETGAPLKTFYDGAFRLAINTQTPIFPVVFPDNVSRCHSSRWWQVRPGKMRVIYLDPIDVTGLTLNDLGTLKQRVYDLMEGELININMGDSLMNHPVAQINDAGK